MDWTFIDYNGNLNGNMTLWFYEFIHEYLYLNMSPETSFTGFNLVHNSISLFVIHIILYNYPYSLSLFLT